MNDSRFWTALLLTVLVGALSLVGLTLLQRDHESNGDAYRLNVFNKYTDCVGSTLTDAAIEKFDQEIAKCDATFDAAIRYQMPSYLKYKYFIVIGLVAGTYIVGTLGVKQRYE